MEELVKKLEQLNELIKAIKAMPPAPPAAASAQKSTLPSLPKLPMAKAPPTPSMTPSVAAAPKISSGSGPNSKKDPKKVAQQIKDGSMSTKTQKVMLKTDSKTGQWYLEPTTPSSI